MIIPKNYFFQNIKIKLNSNAWMTLKVLSGDFPGLNSLKSFISSKNLLILKDWSSLAPKWPIPVPFNGMVHQKSNFYWYLILFRLEAVEASRCHFFKNWLMKHKCPTLLKPLATVIQQNYWSFYPSEPFTFTRYTMRHPVYHDSSEFFLMHELLNLWKKVSYT